LAVVFPFIQGGKIQESEVHRFFNLIRIAPRESHIGDVGLQQLDGGHLGTIETWVLQMIKKHSLIHTMVVDPDFL
jgi:hypothetical protein